MPIPVPRARGGSLADADPVRAYYASFAEREWARLEDPARGTIEWQLITRHLETLEAPARILDIGGGPGRYTIWLAERGHRVTLADLTPELLAIARTKIIEAIVEADATDLSAWDDAFFDAALSLAPSTTPPPTKPRARHAATELARVLRAGGLAFVAFMPRHALSRTIAVSD